MNRMPTTHPSATTSNAATEGVTAADLAATADHTMTLHYDPTEDALSINSCAEFSALLQTAIDNATETATLALLIVNLQRSDRLTALISPLHAEQMRHLLWDRLHPILRIQDHVLGVSDNEYWLLLPGLASPALALLATHRILDAFEAPFIVDDIQVYTNPGIGIVCTPIQGGSANAMLRMADNAQRKARTEHQKFVLAEGNPKSSLPPGNIQKLVGEVLLANTLNVVYQPKVDTRTKRVVSVEALVRWPSDHPQFVPINILIDTVERHGLVEQLTLHVLSTVLRESSGWKAAGLDILIWVNLSASLLSQPHLPRTLAHIMDIWLTPPSAIGLEITENALIQDIEKTTELLFQLKQLGFHLSIDDFGTGYSSFAYLRRFPIDELKIDRVFIQGMTESIQDKQIVQSIIDLAHNFGLPVVAEGVEEEKTLHMLESMDCEQIQGFYFAKPMPAHELLPWCAAFHERNGVMSP